MEQHAHVPEDMKPKDVLHQPIVSPVHHGAMARRSSTDSPWRKASGISDRCAEQSPLHRNHVKASGERRVSSEGGHGVAPNTPVRLKTRAGGRGDDSPDKSPYVPKFGEWDESNPSSGDGFTGIFNKVVTERQTGSAKVPYLIDDSVYMKSDYHGSNRNKPASCWSFCWGKN